MLKVAGMFTVLLASAAVAREQPVATYLLGHPVAMTMADLKNAQGQSVGMATLTDTPHGVLIHVSLTGVPAGTHAFHVHSAGVCEPPFTSAGGHFNPNGKQHGMENPAGMHAGDLPNINVPADGKLTFDAFADGVTLAPGANSLLKPGGTSLVIHAGADDYSTDPTGNAGARYACGVIMQM